MTADGRFGVGQVCTASFVPYLAASVASLRAYNRTLPVAVYLDEPSADLDRVAGVLDVAVEIVDVDVTGLYAASAAELESIRSRLVKIESLRRAPFDTHYYIDSDSLIRGDVAAIADELGPALGAEADLFMLLNRPVPPTFWGDRHLYLVDPQVDRAKAADVVGTAYGLDLDESFIDELVCWNSGMIFGSAAALRQVADRWLALYRRMLTAPNRPSIIPRDQLAFWLTLWELRERVRVAELPRRWNFMAGHLLGITPGTAEVDPSGFGDARVLHLAQNKSDPWALRQVAAALDGLGIVPPS